MMEHQHREGSSHQPDTGPIPSGLVVRDFALLRSRDILRTTWDIEEMLLLQSVEGRAHYGHGAFNGRRFPNVTEDDLVRALQMDSNAIRRKRQALISEITDWAHRAARGEANDSLLTAGYRPLLGIGTFAFLKVNPEDVLRGLYLGGLRDTPEVRVAAEKRYGVQIGAGGLYRVDSAVMQRMGITGEMLARGEHDGKLEEFRRIGLITESPPSPDSTIRYMYLRLHAGPGASDDAAIVCAGLHYGADTAIGVFLADAIDTLEKYVPGGQEGDQDASLARKIEEDWPAMDVGFDQACELAYLAVGGEGIPDSSLRHLLRVDRLVDQCPLEAHLLKVAGHPFALLELGHEKAPNDRFYEMLEGRLERLERSPLPGSRTRH